MYSQRNDLCSYQGNAITSNAKFLVPNSPVYNLSETPMMLYPGRTGFLQPTIQTPCRGPDAIKAWVDHNCHTKGSQKDYKYLGNIAKILHNTDQPSKDKTPSYRSCRTCGLG